ncbi:glycosyltransferase [Dermatobacter hominis]|uniref:glycosyltransferase n=1 Tax=Dermatobacter hominis TaxID=2884263 RepID=UPI001D114C3A|nr:glycosyltransferase [Dermatobacter hominis]UDY34884.1 glycosyltransferase [Dermatobacter hominis]
MLHGTEGPVTAAGLASWLRGFAVERVEDLVADHAPGWRLPATFGGHRVEPDVAADLAYTLGHLHAGGVEAIAGTPLTDAVRTVLSRIDGTRTHTFFSYRVAETLLRWGPTFDGNPLLDGLTDAEVEQVRIACDSSEWLPLLDESILPLNYAGVLARCESARLRLGLPVDEAVVDDLVERARTVLSSNPGHYLDDSNHHVGRFDIYSADVWLFTQPFADRLGELWDEGMATALALVERVMADDGSAVTWGRSTGPLAGALTIELGALAVARRLGDDASTWLGRAALASSGMPGWFDGGVVNAHQHRDADGYRGPFRRLQLTLDLLGKLAWAANELDRADPALTAAVDGEVLAPRDELIPFDSDRPASVWTHRGPTGGLVVPFVGASRSDYLAAPRAPGRFEVPVDSDLAAWLPVLWHGDRRAVPSGVPASVEHRPGGVRATWGTFTFGAEMDPPAEPYTSPGSATVDYSVSGRTVNARWTVTAERAPDAVSLVVPERPDQPLRVTVHGEAGTHVHVDEVDVSGIAEWRSHWSSFSTVHEVEVEPEPVGDGSIRAEVSLTVTPQLRVASTAFGHHYDRSLYGPLTGLVREVACPWGPLGDATVDAGAVDLLHLHWPEWLAFDDLPTHLSIVEEVKGRRIPVVWTAHNLTPHEKRPDAFDPIYELWATSSDAIIHHSHGGMERFRSRYPSADGALHAVIPHGHFGDLWADHPGTDRDDAERALGLTPCDLRIGIVGAPRREKLVVEFLRGVAASSRDDIQVACWSLADTDEVPHDPRIVVAEPYEMTDSAAYAQRLAVCDLLAMPFDPEGEMLATGTVFDAVGLGMPVLRSDWSFLVEVLGDAGIDVGHTADSVAAALDALDPEAVRSARRAAVVRRDELAWDLISARTLALFEDVLAGR